MNLEIVDYNVPRVVKRVYIDLVDLNFNTSATFEVSFFADVEQSIMNLVKKEIVIIEGQEYQAWKNDDNYIIDLVMSKLGLTKK